MIVELVRKEWCDHRWTLALLVAVDALGVLAAHHWLDVPAVPPGAAAFRAFVLIACGTSIPLMAEVFAGDERTGQAATLRRLPAHGRVVVLAKLVAIAFAVVAVAVAMSLVELAASLVPGLATGRTLPLDELLETYADGSMLYALAGVTVLATCAFAVVTRSSLLASLGGFAAIGGAVALVARVEQLGAAPWMHAGATIVGSPVAILAVSGAALAAVAPRGRLARLARLRAALVVGLPIGLASTAVAGVAVATGIGGLPPFDEPEGDVMELEVSRDGRFVAVTLLQRHGLHRQTSVWVANTESFDFHRIESVSARRWSTGVRAEHMRIAGWRADEERPHLFLIDYADGWHIGVDPASGEVTPSSYREHVTHSEYHGVAITRGERGRVVPLEDGTSVEIGSHLPRVPALSRDAVFYADDDHRLHRVDLSNGEDRVVPIDGTDVRYFQVGPEGRRVLVTGSVGRWIAEVETGRSNRIGNEWGQWTGELGVYAYRKDWGQNVWMLSSVDGEATLQLERQVQHLYRLPDGRWLGVERVADALFVFGPDGALERTVRLGREGGER